MTSRSYPDTESANWVLHKQPTDQIADHKFSIWSGEHPVVLANEVPGEEGALAYIVDVLNRASSVDAQGSGDCGAWNEGLAQLRVAMMDMDISAYNAAKHRISKALNIFEKAIALSSTDRGSK